MQLLQPGQVVFGRYRVEKFLGAGGQAFGFAAHDTRAPASRPWERKVFLKQYHDLVPSPQELAAFDQRVATLRDRLHEKEHYICLPKRVGTDNNSLIMIYARVRGQTLRDWMSRGLTQPQCVRFALGLANAIRIIHKFGVIHLDLKPENVMIEENNRDGQSQHFIQIIDLDAARIDGVGFRDKVLGTPMYYSPEHSAPGTFGDVSEKSDVFTLGIMLFELLFKGHPFCSDASYDQAIASRQCVIPHSSYHRDVVMAVYRCLSPDPLRRPSAGRVHFVFREHQALQLETSDPRLRWKTSGTTSSTVPREILAPRPRATRPSRPKLGGPHVSSPPSRREIRRSVDFISDGGGACFRASFTTSQYLGAVELADLRIGALPRNLLQLELAGEATYLVLQPVGLLKSLFRVSRVILNDRPMIAGRRYALHSGDQLQMAGRRINVYVRIV